MLSEKKKRSDLGLHIFLQNSWCPLKKKRSSLWFHLLFPYFSPKIRVFSKKKKWSSLPFALSFPYFCPKFRVFYKKKRSSLRIVLWTNICSRFKTVCAIFEGGLRRPPHLPHPISTTEYLGTLIVIPITVPSQKNLGRQWSFALILWCLPKSWFYSTLLDMKKKLSVILRWKTNLVLKSWWSQGVL